MVGQVVHMNRRGWRYSYDFGRMEQKNLSTGTVRQMRPPKEWTGSDRLARLSGSKAAESSPSKGVLRKQSKVKVKTKGTDTTRKVRNTANGSSSETRIRQKERHISDAKTGKHVETKKLTKKVEVKKHKGKTLEIETIV